MQSDTLTEWFQTPLGAAMLDTEQLVLDTVLADIFGFHAVQVGVPSLPLLRASRMTHHITLASVNPANVLALPQEMPIATQSVDLVLLAHVLEFSEDPHAILREVDRILVPEGRLIITGFNPRSLWGLRRSLPWSSNECPWDGHFISLPRVKDWLSLLDLEVNAGRLWGYGLPVQSPAWRARFAFLEKMGDRWWGIGGGVYMLEAIKRVAGMRLVQRLSRKQARAFTMPSLTVPHKILHDRTQHDD
jgi:SAM-dependent methyltransferase